MGSAVRLSLLGTLAVYNALLLVEVASGRTAPRTADHQVSEAEIQRLLHGVMEQLGIARPRVEYPAHQATNIVGPQSIQGRIYILSIKERLLFLCLARKKKKLPLHLSTTLPCKREIDVWCTTSPWPPGGAHEGLQHLGPYGNIPNIVAELTGDNVPKDFSEDHGYPDPPNPCPIGKTGTTQSTDFNQNKLSVSLNMSNSSWPFLMYSTIFLTDSIVLI